MKKFIFLLMFGLFSLYSYADVKPIKSTFNEVIVMNAIDVELPVIQEDIVKTCYARFCWNVSETLRECTEWNEVPCATTIEVEVTKDL